jgi:hypothetical protein
MSIREIGCCGAYCRTCRALTEGSCLGCKLGYEDGGRDINKARCKIKVCCFKEKGFETCADCTSYNSCQTVQGLYDKSGYKYRKYRQSTEFIMGNGYDNFIRIADEWKGPYGKFD